MNHDKELKRLQVLDADVQMIQTNELFKLVAKEIEKVDPDDKDDVLKKYELYEKKFKG